MKSGRRERECYRKVLQAQVCMRMHPSFASCANPVLSSPPREPQALADAGLEASQVHNVEVVGGTCRVPAVVRQLTDFFGREPSRTLNAKETVSRGCALQVGTATVSLLCTACVAWLRPAGGLSVTCAHADL